MKKILFLVLITLMFEMCKQEQSNQTQILPVCTDSLWNYVYQDTCNYSGVRYFRIYTISKCESVTGIITHMQHQGDGDLNITLQIDEIQKNVLNKLNLQINASNPNDTLLHKFCLATVKNNLEAEIIFDTIPKTEAQDPGGDDEDARESYEDYKTKNFTRILDSITIKTSDTVIITGRWVMDFECRDYPNNVGPFNPHFEIHPVSKIEHFK